MSHQPAEPIEVLRGIWSAQGQTVADLGDDGTAKPCKRMADIGFDDLAGTDGDLRSAWRSRLKREGKLNPEADSVASLILGPADDRR